MISEIKIFKRNEDNHINPSQNGIEPMSLNDKDISVNHKSYNGIVNQINKYVNDIFFDIKILEIWQKQGGQTLEINRDTYERIIPNVKICVLLKVSCQTYLQKWLFPVLHSYDVDFLFSKISDDDHRSFKTAIAVGI